MKVQELLEFFSVFVAEDGVIGEHMARFLDIGATCPRIINHKHKYSIRSLGNKEWSKRGKEIGQDPNYAILHKNLQLREYERNPEALYGAITRIYRDIFRDILIKEQGGGALNDTASFIRQNKLAVT